jgi:hypothetical protein
VGAPPIDRLVAELLHLAPARSDDAARELPRRYIAADADECPAKAAFGPIADKAKADGCAIDRLNTGHDIMLEAPHELADLLLAGITS